MRDLERFHEDLIVCSACIAGEVPSKIIKDDISPAHANPSNGINGCSEMIIIWSSSATRWRTLPSVPTVKRFLQQKANRVIIQLAKEYGIKLVCTNDSHFVDKENAEAHDHLLCLSTGKDLDDPSRMLYSKQEWFKTREEMNEVFHDIPKPPLTLEILNKVEVYNIEHAPIMPFFPIPESLRYRGMSGTRSSRRSSSTMSSPVTRTATTRCLPRRGDKKIKKLGGYDKIYRIKFEADYLSELAYRRC